MPNPATLRRRPDAAGAVRSLRHYVRTYEDAQAYARRIEVAATEAAGRLLGRPVPDMEALRAALARIGAA
jgi:hypothetical protein